MPVLRSLVVVMAVAVALVLLAASAEASPYRKGGSQRPRCDPTFTLAAVTCLAESRCFPECTDKRDCIRNELCCPDRGTTKLHCTPPFTRPGI